MAVSVWDLCELQKVSLADLVEKSGLDDNRVTAIILGRWTPSPTERQRIAAAFSLTVEEIAWGHKTPVQHLYGHGPGGQTS
ncbi:MAG: helix-turn-helix domain-containing protein [Deltaproteobacteria bacterium]